MAGGRNARDDISWRHGEIYPALLAAIVVFFIVSAVISTVIAALHLLFWVAVVLVVVFGAFKLSSGMRRREQR